MNALDCTREKVFVYVYVRMCACMRWGAQVRMQSSAQLDALDRTHVEQKQK